MSAVAGRVLILPKSAYVAGTTYNMLDLVKYNNKTFMAKRTNTNVTPVDGADWMELTDDGVQSFKGRAGVVNPAKGDYDISQISPLNGATVGMVPVVVNVGTAQSPVYEFGLSYISGGGIGTCGSIQPMSYAYLVVPNAEFNVASGSYLSVVFSTDFYYDGIHTLKLAIGESSYSVKINGQNPEANVIYVRSGDAGIFVYDGTNFQLIGTSGGGHVIVDQDGNELTQEPKMKFLDAFVDDNSTDGATEIENIKEHTTESDYENAIEDGIHVIDDGDDAVIGAVSDDYVEVVADGNKTLKALLQDLYDAMDRTKLLGTAYVKRWTWSDGYSEYSLIYGENTFFRFTNIGVDGTYTAVILGSNNRSGYFANGTEDTTTKPSSGLKIRLYYGNKKAIVDLQTTANRCNYNNTTSGLTATNVQNAINELSGKTVKVNRLTYTVTTSALANTIGGNEGQFYISQMTGYSPAIEARTIAHNVISTFCTEDPRYLAVVSIASNGSVIVNTSLPADYEIIIEEIYI